MTKRIHFSGPPTVLSVLWDDLLLKILEKFDDKKSWRLVCKEFLKIEALSRKRIRILRPEILHRSIKSFPSLEHLDLSACSCLTNEMLSWVCSDHLRRVNLSRATGVDHRGLEFLVKQCPSLEEIDLSYCSRLGDSEAAALSLAPNLKSVILVKCLKITDIGLVRIAVGCSKLLSLNLKWCMEISDLGIELLAAKCKDLRFLDISYLSVTDKGLSSIACMKKLEVLVMVGCRMVDDDGLECLKRCSSHIQKVDVSRCINISSSGMMSLLEGNEKLQELGAAYCLDELTVPVLAKIIEFKNLKTLRLDACVLFPSAIETISRNCRSLTEIGLSKCLGVTDDGINSLVKYCNELRILDVTCCHQLTDAALHAIASSCKKLRCLKMESCSLFTGNGLEKIGTGCSFLQELDLTDCNIDDSALKHISRCTELQIIKLGLCLNISNEGIAYIGSNCKELRELDLYRCAGIGDDGLAALVTGCKNLKRINICYCTEITDAGLKHIGSLDELWELEMRGLTRVTCLGMALMARGCTRLAQLDIKRCYAINDLGIWALARHAINLRQVNISYCRISDGGLYLLFSELKCLQDVKMLHLTRVSLDGFELALRASESVKKVKMLDALKYLLSPDLIHMLQTRGCKFRWLNKPLLL
ncbi:F-box/LRR-repeat protein 3-like [Nymphaea colorata]|nr:F-box/LRR-repeat protein 3-like [Nymphaea colorata]